MAVRLLVRRLNAFKTRFLAELEFPSGFDGFQPATILDGQTHRKMPERSLVPRESVLKDIVGNGFTWAVQTFRRTVEVRLTRKLDPSKRHKIKKNLVMCLVCGHYHEGHTICGNCYKKVREETDLMQKAIQDEWKLDAVDKAVVVVYDKEAKDQGEFWKGKRIVEMKKERPDWFHHNLRAKTRREDDSSEDGLQINAKSIISHVK